jgi:hypothetical protein
MLIKIGLENGFLDKSVAWVLDYPGCISSGADSNEAILKVPRALVDYQNWVEKHTENSWLGDLGNFDVRLVQALDFDGGKNAPINFFENDRVPLTPTEIEQGLQLLAWSRSDLLEIATSFSDEELDRSFEGERWSIRGIVGHVAHSEHWYLDRLGLAGQPESKLPQDVFAKLQVVRERMNQVLPNLAGSEEVREVQGEWWSARKILRRVAWHERDHIGHIIQLMSYL